MVQVYWNNLDYTFSTVLEPKWSAPWQVINRTKNSYRIETLEGLPINGRFSSQRLRQFIPRGETSLAKAQEIIEQELEWRRREDAEDKIETKEGPTHHHDNTEPGDSTKDGVTSRSASEDPEPVDHCMAEMHEEESGSGIEDVDEDT